MGGDFLARKIYTIPECVIVEIGIQTHSNCTKNRLVHNLLCGGKFFVWSLILQILDLSGVIAKKKSQIWFSDFTRGNNLFAEFMYGI